MATLRLGEVITQAAIDKLKAGIGERIGAINLEKGDGIEVSIPRTSGGPSIDGSDFYTGGMGPAIPEGALPAIIVAEGFAEFTEEGPHSFSFMPNILVRAVDEDANRETLDLKLKRLARAIIETLWDDPPKEALTGSAYTFRPYQSRPGPVSEPDNEVPDWRSHTDVIFQAVQSEGD